MQRTRTLIVSVASATIFTLASADAADVRNIITGSRIPDEGYCDQPYVVVTADGNWLCTLTTGAGHEGQGGQHVVSTISSDQGKTWSPLTDIEPPDGPEASWAVPLATPSGRVYAFYTYNGDKVYNLPDGKKMRADTHGWYAMKYSDDNGKTWSKERYRIPLRATACDRANDFDGKVQMFWGIDKPKAADGRVFFSFTKLGRYFLANSEGWLYCSDNILTEPAVEEIHWDLRPEGEHGIRESAFGSVQEEHNMLPLGGERLYCIYRTTMGYPCHAYSENGGRTWTKPEPMTYTPGGRTIKNPRACPKLWRCGNGKFLFWYHFHSGRSFQDRNPAWICGGVTKNGKLHWSQPEILLYDDGPKTRMSYPDLIEQDGRYWVTETQKSVARIHELDSALLEDMWKQLDDELPSQPVSSGCIAQFNASDLTTGNAKIGPPLALDSEKGFTVDLWLTVDRFTPGQVLLDTRDEDGCGWALSMGENKTLKLSIDDGEHRGTWDSDPNLLNEGQAQHLAFVVDGGPNIITVVVDGVLCDGGQDRQFGWGRFDPRIGDVSGTRSVKADLTGVTISNLRIYDRYLRTAEVVRNYRAAAN